VGFVRLKDGNVDELVERLLAKDSLVRRADLGVDDHFRSDSEWKRIISTRD